MKNPVMINNQMAENIVIALIVAQRESQLDDESITDMVDAVYCESIPSWRIHTHRL